MSTPDTTLIGVKLQAAGENLNTWGDPNLNNDLIVGARSAHGWNSKTINGDTTLSETNYSTTNDSEVATIKLVAGTVAAAFNFVLPGRAKRLVIWNATGYTATIKLAATTGFSLPNGRWTVVTTDGTTDAYNHGSNYVGTGYSVTNAGDTANKSYVDTAIATASLPATAGTILNSGSDTTANYHLAKHTSAKTNAAWATANPAGNENAQLTVQDLALVDGGVKAALFTAVAGRMYWISNGSTFTVTLPAAIAAKDIICFVIGFNCSITFSPNGNAINGSTSSLVITDQQTLFISVPDATSGWS